MALLAARQIAGPRCVSGEGEDDENRVLRRFGGRDPAVFLFTGSAVSNRKKINSWSSVCRRNFRGCNGQKKSCLPFRDRYLTRSLTDKLSCISRTRWNHNPLMHDARFDA